MTKARSDCCKLPLKTLKDDKEEAQEVTASLAAAKEFSMNAAKVAVLSDLDEIFTLKENKELH